MVKVVVSLVADGLEIIADVSISTDKVIKIVALDLVISPWSR